MGVWAVVVAAGRGTRFGAAKQYEQLGQRRVLDHAVASARPHVDGLVLVVPPGPTPAEPGADVVVVGGESRSASVRAGLAVVPDAAEVVLVHDAARPLAPPELFLAVIEAVRAGADAAVPALAVPDTIKRVEGDRVVATLDRTDLVAVQTPQAFLAAALRRAHVGDPEATDDAALVEAAGGRVVVVAGDPRNRKLTTPDDLRVAATLMQP